MRCVYLGARIFYCTIFLMFLLQACSFGPHTGKNGSPDKCAEEKSVAERIGKQIAVLRDKPALSLDDVRDIITPLGPHYVADGRCSEHLSGLKSIALSVLRARSSDVSDALRFLCSQVTDPEDKDMIAAVGIIEERKVARSALEYIHMPTDDCITQ